MPESVGQPVVVDSRGGASGTIAAALVAKAPADGASAPDVQPRLTEMGGGIRGQLASGLEPAARERRTSLSEIVKEADVRVE
jgi:hypothetical protein